MNRYPNVVERALAEVGVHLPALSWQIWRLVRVMDQRYEGHYFTRRIALRCIRAIDAVSDLLIWFHDRHLERQMEWEARQRKLP